ncbi:MAG: P-II family nitrogen regulator [Thiohalobacterales bacterium]
MSDHNITYLTDVSLLTVIVQVGLADDILKAARDAGASVGAIGHHARGIGVRERLGILGVAVETEKDVISILVSNEQRDLIFDTIYRAAGLDTPGRGFVYVTPLEKAATYVPESIMQRIKDKA